MRDVGHRKARKIGAWLDASGFDTYLLESRFGTWTTRTADDPAVALCGVDNPIARAALEYPGFGLVVEAGLGAGPEAFRRLSIHSFPGSRRAEEIWSKDVGASAANVEEIPAFQARQQWGCESLPLRQLIATCGKPNKTGPFSSHRIRTVETLAGTRGPAQPATIVAPEEGRILGRQASFLTAESLKPASAIRRDDGMSDLARQCRPPANAGRDLISRNREREDRTVICCAAALRRKS